MSSINNISLHAPRGWQELTQPQLEYVLTMCASGEVSVQELKTLCLLRFNAFVPGRMFPDPDNDGQMLVELHPTDSTTLTSDKKTLPASDGKHKDVYVVATEQIAAACAFLDWLDMPPSVPIRLDAIHVGKKAYHAPAADFSDVSFQNFLVADNLYAGFLHTRDAALLDKLAGVLYQLPEPSALNHMQRYNVFMWFTGLKTWFISRFPDLFTVSTAGTPTESLFKRLTDNTDAQIRALTGGDVTKEPQVLQTDTIRALTELNAKVRESRESHN